MTSPPFSSSPTTTAPTQSPLLSFPLLLLLKTPSPTPTSDKYTLALSLPDGTPPPLYIPVLTHTLRPDPLIALLLAHLAPPAPAPAPPPPFPYGALILTSQRAAAALNAALSAPAVQSKLGGGARLWDGLVIYTVGPATEAAVREVCANHGIGGGVEVRGGEDAGSGEVLARGMLGQWGQGEETALRYEIFGEGGGEEEARGGGGGGGGGQEEGVAAAAERGGIKMMGCQPLTRRRKKPVLFLAGETRRDVIPRLLQSADLPAEERIKVDEMTVYESAELESFAFEYAGALAKTETVAGPRWTVVFSPMAGRGMLKGLGWLDDGTGKVSRGKMEGRRDYICCIGPTTRAYLSREFGLEADVVAEKPSPEGVREGIGRYMAASGKS